MAHIAFSSKPISPRASTEFFCFERSVFSKDVSTELIWTFDSGKEGGKNVPICVIVSY